MIPSGPTNFANLVAPFSPLGRQPVGQETEDLTNTTFRPLEQGAESARNENRRAPDERPNDTSEQQRLQQDREAIRERDNKERERHQQQEQEEQQREIQQLAARDREVRAHEQAHAAIGGKYAGAPQYEYTRGPDGRAYAVAGEVPIDTSRIPDDPLATIAKAKLIQRAANAPAEPSDQDRRVAAEAARMELEARAELRLQEAEEAKAERAQRADETETRKAERESREEEEARRQERRQALLSEYNQRNMDINRRLVDIGVVSGPTPGSLINQRI